MHPATDHNGTHAVLDDFAASPDAAAELARYKQILTATAHALGLPGGDLNTIPAAAAEAYDAARNLREQVDRFNAARQRLADDLDDAHAEVERLRAVLREILGHFDQLGSIGDLNNVVRTCWVNVKKVNSWRAALDEAKAGENRA